MREFLKLFEFYTPFNFVLFDHNPEGLKMTGRAKGGTRAPAASSRSAGTTGGGAPAGHLGASGHGAEPITVTVTKARLIGPETKAMCDRLLGWCAPDTSAAAAAVAALLPGVQVGDKPPLLLMQWGPPAAGFTFTCTMSTVDIQYIRVSALGIPTHATITLVMKEEPAFFPMTNPTSGGRPGRSRHMMHADETLMSVATSKFGSPSAWRAIADINGIDDPGAVRPGDVVYLPAREELRELTGAAR